MIALLPALVLAICDWVAVATGRKRLEYVFKPLTLVALIVTAYAAGPPNMWVQVAWLVPDNVTWLFVLAALAFSLIGDIFLMLPSDRFVAGLAAFLVAHVCYIVAFYESFRSIWAYVLAAAVFVVSTVLFLRVRRGILQKGQAKLVLPVTLYVIAIGTMVTAVVGTMFLSPVPVSIEGFRGLEVPGWPERAATAAALGAILFYISDALIGWSRFVKDFKHSRLAIMVTYHLGQMGFVLYLIRS